MARSLFGGNTRYENQSFNDILIDLENDKINVNNGIIEIENNLQSLNANNYWNKNVPFNFISLINYSLRFFRTTREELTEIQEELKIEVIKTHCIRLQKIGLVADEINIKIGLCWHREYDLKDYENSNFQIVESIYNITRGMAVSLLDISNLSNRLEDFIGKKEINMKNNTIKNDISNATFGDNTTIILGENIQLNNIHSEKGDFKKLKDLFKESGISEEDIEELKIIIENEIPNEENKTYGNKTNEWISKILNKSLDGSWAIGIGAAGKLLADGLKLYFGWNN